MNITTKYEIGEKLYRAEQMFYDKKDDEGYSYRSRMEGQYKVVTYQIKEVNVIASGIQYNLGDSMFLVEKDVGNEHFSMTNDYYWSSDRAGAKKWVRERIRLHYESVLKSWV